MKVKIIAVIALILCILMTGCSSNTSSSTENKSTANEAVATETNVESDDEMFTSRDIDTGYDEETAVKITLSQGKTTSSSDSVSIDGNTITIKSEGTYILSGKLTDGMVIVDANEKDKVQIVLDNADITSTSSSPIYAKSCDKLFITTANKSTNTLSTTGAFEAIDDNNIDSVIFAKSDLTLNGTGSLNISTQYGHGVVSKDDLVITSGTYEISAAGHGLSGKDSVRILSPSINITSGKDGINSENTDNTEKGFVYIKSGTITISSDGDGISSSLYAEIKGGTFDIVTADGAGETKTNNDRGFDKFSFNDTGDTEDTVSTKGIKAESSIVISGGTFTIDSNDDAIHSNDKAVINGGTLTLKTGDDGIHSDNELSITNGKIKITQSYEGIESCSINISGGDIDIVSSDDGLNAGGGNDSSGGDPRQGFSQDNFSSSSASLVISNGNINVNAGGDGLDSNGTLEISGGTIYVEGPENDGNGALDSDSSPVISGGTVIAAGSAGMAENFSSDSTQCSIMVNVDSQQGGEISLKDSSGKVLATMTTEKTFSNVVISTPDIKVGETYTVVAGNSSQSVEMTQTIYGESSGMGGGGKGGMNGGGMNGGDMNGGGMNGGMGGGPKMDMQQ